MRVLEYGADEFTTKPISAESVVDKVYSMLTTRKPNQYQTKMITDESYGLQRPLYELSISDLTLKSTSATRT